MYVLVYPLAFSALSLQEFYYLPLAWSKFEWRVEPVILIIILSYLFSKLSLDKGFPFIKITMYTFYYVFFCIIPCYLYKTGYNPNYISVTFEVSEYMFGFQLVIISLVAYEFGSSRVGRQKVPRSYLLAFETKGMSPYVIYFCPAIAAGSIVAFSIIVGNPILLIADRSEFADYFDLDSSPASFAMVSMLTRVPALMALAILTTLLVTKSKVSSAPIFPVIMLITLPFSILANFPTAIPRFWLGSIIFCIALIYMISRDGIVRKMYSAAVLFALLVAFPFAGILRNYFSDDRVHSFRTLVLDGYSNGQYDIFMMLLAVVRYVNVFGYTNGNQILGSVLFWVPRSIYGGKPYGTGYMVAQALQFDFYNLATPLLSEMYIDFGVVGVAVSFVLFGFVITKQEKLVSLGKATEIRKIVLAFVGGWMVILQRGSMNVAISNLVPLLILAWFVSVYFYGPKWRSERQYV